MPFIVANSIMLQNAVIAKTGKAARQCDFY